MPAHGAAELITEYLHRESNPDQQFRKLLFYPLNYGDAPRDGMQAAEAQAPRAPQAARLQR